MNIKGARMAEMSNKKQTSYVNWKSIPGGFDALNTKHLYPSNNESGIPTLAQAPLSCVPKWLAPYRAKVRAPEDLEDTGVHFFLDDYRFESIWRRPVQTLSSIQKWEVALTPDFSLYYNAPRIMQMWNTYRTRWVGCWWVANGITVIPTVSWGSHDSYDFCFLGLPERSVLAVSTVGTQKDELFKAPFLAGFREMVRRLQPTMVMNYGIPYEEMYALAEVISYPDYWHSVKSKHRKYGSDEAYEQKLNEAEDDDFEIDF
jgi:hypothetical protein